MQLYLMGHSQREYAFLPRVVETVKRLVDIEAEGDALKGADSAIDRTA